MKEIRSPIPRPMIRRVVDDDLKRELFRIVCYFHASASLSSPENQVGRIPVLQLLAEDNQESEIVSSLLNVAMRIRLLDEQLWDKSDEIKRNFTYKTGLLWESEATSKVNDLSVREACNKIIHASDIGFFVDESKYDTDVLSPRYLLPRISLYGNRGRSPWRAEVSVDEFIEASYWISRYV